MANPMFRSVTILVPYDKPEKLIELTKEALAALEGGADDVRFYPTIGNSGSKHIHYPDNAPVLNTLPSEEGG